MAVSHVAAEGLIAAEGQFAAEGLIAAEGQYAFPFSLTKYSAIFAEVKGYFGIVEFG